MRIFLFVVLIVLIGLTVATCNNIENPERKKSFNSFDFSYNDVFSTCFSIKFTHSDTVFIKQHFASFFSDTPKSKTTYYAMLTQTDKTKLDSFITQSKFGSLDTLYYQSYQDGIDYQFYFDNDTIKKLIRVHSDSVPTQLKALKNWILDTKERLQLHQVDTTIDFKSTKYFLSLTLEAPPIKFRTPIVE